MTPPKGTPSAVKMTIYVNPARRRVFEELSATMGLSYSHALQIAAMDWLERHAHKDEFDAIDERGIDHGTVGQGPKGS